MAGTLGPSVVAAPAEESAVVDRHGSQLVPSAMLKAYIPILLFVIVAIGFAIWVGRVEMPLPDRKAPEEKPE